MTKAIKLTLFAAVSLIVVFLIFWSILLKWQLANGDWNHDFADFHDQRDVALVHGYTTAPLYGWDVSLLWQKENDKWFVYYINHETSGWEDYSLKRDGVYLEVICDDALLAKLNTSTGEYFHYKQNLLYKTPIHIIHRDHLEDRQKWTYWRPDDPGSL